jgi:predicted transcriptional regulator
MSKEKTIPLSPSETEILRLVWELENASVQDVYDALPAGRSIASATVQTLLRRLEKKGYVKHDVRGKAHMFYPVAKREDVIGSAVGAFVDKLFGGDALPLVHYLAKHGNISHADIEGLKNLIDTNDDKDQKGKS